MTQDVAELAGWVVEADWACWIPIKTSLKPVWHLVCFRGMSSNAAIMKGSRMLVLSRKEGEELVIDGGIRVKIVRSRGNRVVIGVEAPMEVSIQRAELCDAEEDSIQYHRKSA